MNFQTRKLSELAQYANNPRNNNDAVSKVKESILRYGYKVPIVIDSSGVIVAGHTRFAALLQIHEETGQYEEITVVLADDLTENQLKEFRIVDNQVAAIATWDFTKLQIELGTLEDFMLEDFGIIPGFDTDLILPPDIDPNNEPQTGVKISIGSDSFTMSETEYHAWCSYIIDSKGVSVLDFVRSALEIAPEDRTYAEIPPGQ